ncbi:MAG: Rrf2 family transcriptional regulator [bacterium]|nr:Rrf2 family transcriptional regulator [bacterium]
MIITKATQYALRAVIYIAENDNGKFIPVKDIAKATDASHFFLSKIMNTLIQHGLIESYKGPNGGVKLARSVDKMTLNDVVEAIEGKEFLKDCFVGLSECNDDCNCPVHDDWGSIRQQIFDMLSKKTIREIVEK